VVAPPRDAEDEPDERDSGVQIWEKKAGMHSIVAITRHDLIFSPTVRDSKVREACDQLEEGVGPRKIFGTADTLIPFRDITEIHMEHRRYGLTVWYKADFETKQVNAFFTELKDLKEVFAALRKRLGPEWRAETVQYSRARAMREPGLGLVLVTAFTGVLYALRNNFSAGRWGGGLWILIAGGAFALVCLIWLIVVLRDPPLITSLKPPEE
jgi:hypothetical protein